MQISESFRLSISREELDTIVKEKVRSILRDTERSILAADHDMNLKYQIQNDPPDEPLLDGVDINIDFPWEIEDL